MSKSNREYYEERQKKKKMREESSRKSEHELVESAEKQPKKQVRISFTDKNQEGLKEKRKEQSVATVTPKIEKAATKEAVKQEPPKTVAQESLPVRGKVPPKKETVASKVQAKKVPSVANAEKVQVHTLSQDNGVKKKAAPAPKEKSKKPVYMKFPQKEEPAEKKKLREEEKATNQNALKAKPPLEKQKVENAAKKKKPVNDAKAKAKAKKQRRKLKGLSKGPIVAICIILLVVIGGIAAWRYLPIGGLLHRGDKPVAETVIYGVNFAVGNDTVQKITDKGTDVLTLENMPYYTEGLYMIPVNCLNEVFGLHVTISEDGTKAAISDDKVRMNIESGVLAGTVNDLSQNLSGIPSLHNGVLYLAANDISGIFGYQTDESDSTKAISFLLPDLELAKPNVWFSTDKESYTPGETVRYAMMNAEDNAPMIQYRWENKQARFFTPGEYHITLQGKDMLGQWSDVSERTIAVSGDNYSGASQVPVLMYHYFVEDEQEVLEGGKQYGNGAVMWIGQFREHMEYLKNNGFQTLSVSEFQSYADCGVLPPQKSVVLILDDGYENNYSLVFPILKELGLKANIAPIVKRSQTKAAADKESGNLRFLSFDELREMSESGLVEIGCHTYSCHGYEEPYSGDEGFFLTQPTYNSDYGRTETETEYQSRVINDLILSRNILSTELGIEHPFFVYPYGRESDFVQSTLKNLGYSCAFVIRDQYATPRVNTFEVPRFAISPRTTMEEFVTIVAAEK